MLAVANMVMDGYPA